LDLRNDPNYIASLGETIKVLSFIIPQGLLVFFPSYPILKNCQQHWQNTGVWANIEASKVTLTLLQS
jgi:regulator of telomere elongation helicase 1